MNTQMDHGLTKEDVKVMKGIAVLLMLMHHLWYFPERIYGGGVWYRFRIFEQPATILFGGFAQICVGMFFFLGGYGLYLSQNGKQYDLIGRLKKLYVSYWKVFVIFVPIGYLFFSNQPAYVDEWAIYGTFSAYSAHKLISNFLGVANTLNREWWFLYSYAVALVTFPLIRGVIKGKGTCRNLLLVILYTVFTATLLPALGKLPELGTLNNNYLYAQLICQRAPEVSCFWMGCIAAENGLLDRLKNGLETHGLLNPIFDVLTWGVMVFLRQFTIGNMLDLFYVPAMVLTGADLLGRSGLLRRGALAIGKQSTNMWLIHTFFCYYFLAAVKIVVAPKWAVPSLLVLVVLSYLASVLLDLFWKGVSRLWKKACACKTVTSLIRTR